MSEDDGLDEVRALLEEVRVPDGHGGLIPHHVGRDFDPWFERVLAEVRRYGKRERAKGGLEVLNTSLLTCSAPGTDWEPCVHHLGQRECAIGRRERLEREMGDG